MKPQPGIHPGLLDVIFVLTLMFLLTSLLAVNQSLENENGKRAGVARPESHVAIPLVEQAAAAPAPAEEAIFTLEIDAGGRFLSQGQPISPDQLTNQLKRRQPRSVRVRADGRLKVQPYIQALSLIQQACNPNLLLSHEIQSNIAE